MVGTYGLRGCITALTPAAKNGSICPLLKFLPLKHCKLKKK